MSDVSQEREDFKRPLFVMLALVGLIFSGLLVGIEPTGGDPDRLYRPIKQELATSIREGKLPLWSHRMGLGLPLMAESHVAALYPPNLVFYRVFDVNMAYRLLMFAHQLGMAAATFFYARKLGIRPWGAALSGLTFSLCGFQAIHASHEWSYHALAYLPWILLLTESCLESGSLATAAGLSLLIGVQWTLGHYQIQTWTNGLVVFTAFWRQLGPARSVRRLALVLFAVLLGGLIAALPLALSWEFAGSVGQTSRDARSLLYFIYPPNHWFEPLLPTMLQDLYAKPEAQYWFKHLTTGHEARFYVGGIPLILAIVGYLDTGKGRPTTTLWRVLIPLTLIQATMPAWWYGGAEALLSVPGLGLFRAPARYTVLTSLGLALLAGQGLDRTISRLRFQVGLTLSLVGFVAAVLFARQWASQDGLREILAATNVTTRLAFAAFLAFVGLVAVLLWRLGRVCEWLILGLVAIELGTLFYQATVRWGWSIPVPASSPILEELAKTPGVRRVAGSLDDLPLRAGLATATPYNGFNPTWIQQFINKIQKPIDTATPLSFRWLRRYGITHGVWSVPIPDVQGVRVQQRTDPGLDQLVYVPEGQSPRRDWRLVEIADPLPEVRIATKLIHAGDWQEYLEHVAISNDPGDSIYIGKDYPLPMGPKGPARSFRIREWSGDSGIIEHDGECELILCRTYDPGWKVSLNGGPERPVARVEGGLQSVRLTGEGPTRVELRYQPAALVPGAIVSGLATFVAVATLLVSRIRSQTLPRSL